MFLSIINFILGMEVDEIRADFLNTQYKLSKWLNQEMYLVNYV